MTGELVKDDLSVIYKRPSHKDVLKFSHPLAEQQIDAVDKVLAELDVASIPKLMVWNKVRCVSFAALGITSCTSVFCFLHVLMM